MTGLPTSTPPARHTRPPSTRRGPELLELLAKEWSTVATAAALSLKLRIADTHIRRPSRTTAHDRLACVRRTRTSLPR